MMVSSILALAMLWAAPTDINTARKAYSTCLTELVRSSLKKKETAEAFDAQVGSACAGQEEAFREASIASDMSRGISRKTAEQGVTDEIADYVTSAKERFQGFLASGETMPD